MSQTNPVGVELFSYVNTSLFFHHLRLSIVMINLHAAVSENVVQCKEVSGWGKITVCISSRPLSGKSPKRPFYSCLLGDLAFEWQRGWR